MKNKIAITLTIAAVCFFASNFVQANSENKFKLPENVKLLKKDGGWCWYQDERSVIIGDNIFFGSVKTPSGDIDITRWNIKTGDTQNITLDPNFNSDDHAVASLLVLDDNRILATYSSHGYNAIDKKQNHILFYTTTKNPADISQWEDLKTLKGHGCYTNLMKTSDGTIYNFFRGQKSCPAYCLSKDNGNTFEAGGNALFFSAKHGIDPKRTKVDGIRPYVKYAIGKNDDMHFITTEAHPLGYDNSIYHGYIKNKEMFTSDGQKIIDLPKGEQQAPLLTKFTKIFDGDSNNVAWTTDLNIDKNNQLVAIFTVMKDCANVRNLRNHESFDNRHFYACYDGKNWHVNEMAYAGRALFLSQPQYTGLCAIDTQDSNTVYVSTDANPQTGAALISTADGLRHHEIFKAVTSDKGKTWKWTAITQNSTYDNLRPIVPILPNDFKGNSPVLWCVGSLKNFCNYQLDIVGYIEK